MIDRHSFFLAATATLLTSLSACGGSANPSPDPISKAITAPALIVSPQSNYKGSNGEVDINKVNAIQKNYLNNLGASK